MIGSPTTSSTPVAHARAEVSNPPNTDASSEALARAREIVAGVIERRGAKPVVGIMVGQHDQSDAVQAALAALQSSAPSVASDEPTEAALSAAGDFIAGWSNASNEDVRALCRVILAAQRRALRSDATTQAVVSDAENERALLQLIAERDAAEDALSRAVAAVIGRPVEWSNLYGYHEALDEIDETLTALRSVASQEGLRSAVIEECAGERQEVERRNATIFAMKKALRDDRRFERWADAPLLGFAVKMYDMAHGEIS